MENKFDVKKLVIAIIIIVLISIIGYFLYSYFNKGDDTPTNNTPTSTEDYKISSIYQTTLKDTEKEFTLKGKKITLKLVNGVLYVNGNAISGVKAETAQVTEQVIIFTYKGSCHDIISYVIDSDGNSVSFTKNNYQLYDFRMLNGKCVAAGSDKCPCLLENNCKENASITLTYTGDELEIK